MVGGGLDWVSIPGAVLGKHLPFWQILREFLAGLPETLKFACQKVPISVFFNTRTETEKTDCYPPPGTPQGRSLAHSHRQWPTSDFRTSGRHPPVPLLHSLCPKDRTWLFSVF